MAFNFRKAGGLLGGMMQPDDGQQPGGMGGLLGSLLGRTAAGAAGPFTPPAGIPELPQSAPMPEAAPAKPASFWEGGDKFGWRDGAAGALAAIGDAFAQQNGADGGSVAMLSQGRAAKLAADKAMRAAEAKRATDFQDWQTREQWKLDHPAAPEATAEQRNFQAYRGMDTRGRDEFLRYQDAVNPRFTNTPSGTQYIPRTSRLPQGYDPNEWDVVDGPAPNAPQPAPGASASSMPTLSQDQWRAAVEALGAEGAENWRRRNNVQIGDR